jgi:hypothetical protein
MKQNGKKAQKKERKKERNKKTEKKGKVEEVKEMLLSSGSV